MKDNSRQNFYTQFRILGIYQFVGGIIGLLILFYSIYNSGIHVIPVFFLLIIFFLFFAYSIICGLLCLRSHDLALPLSKINQVLQLIGIGIGGYSYSYVAGVNLSLKLNFPDLSSFNFALGISKMEMRFNTNSEFSMLEINLVALALMIWIDRFQRKITNEQLKATTEQIGSS